MLKSGNLNVNNFDVIKSCKSKVECEIDEAFLVKKTVSIHESAIVYGRCDEMKSERLSLHVSYIFYILQATACSLITASFIRVFIRVI